MSERKLKVIFIAGCSRSGSTLLDRILGQIDGFFSLGEMCYFWERGVIQNQLCGCGKPFKECEFWQKVIREAFGGFDKVNSNHILKLHHSIQRIKYILWLACPSLSPPRYRTTLDEYIKIWSRLYRAIYKISDNKVLIDSSKRPSHGFLLNAIPNLDLRVIHLVRDSRAVAYSWQRKKRRPEIYWKEEYMSKLSILISVREWILSNSFSEILRRVVPHYSLIRYEDLVTQPQKTLTQLFENLGMEIPKLDSLFNGQVINLGVNHTVSGNPMRFKQGITEIKLDEEWKQKMPAHKRVAVTLLTWPFLLRYGYFRRK